MPLHRVVFLIGLAIWAAVGYPAAAQTMPAGYAGSEACAVCHEDISKAFAKNPHNAVETDKKTRGMGHGWTGRACESCHGPAQKHTDSASAEDIRNPLKMTAAAADKLCLTCHLNEPTNVGRLQSSHMKDQVACTSCHKIHADGSDGLVARKATAINEQCASCHINVWAQFQRPAHHKLPEGAMSCVDCHNPHGSARPAMGQSFGANEPGCINCHGDKRGPFTFEHAVVRFEGCAACHEPHGSANPRMLTRQEVRLVCLECHSNLPVVKTTNSALGVVPPAFHDIRLPRYQNCTVCHQKVHGSYVDRNLLR
ncbi:MAG: DmsE family decaheme c-type cytochrome [Bryobacteraceae bacterium]